jgi:hypothetical protein
MTLERTEEHSGCGELDATTWFYIAILAGIRRDTIETDGE